MNTTQPQPSASDMLTHLSKLQQYLETLKRHGIKRFQDITLKINHDDPDYFDPILEVDGEDIQVISSNTKECTGELRYFLQSIEKTRGFFNPITGIGSPPDCTERDILDSNKPKDILRKMLAMIVDEEFCLASENAMLTEAEQNRIPY